MSFTAIIKDNVIGKTPNILSKIAEQKINKDKPTLENIPTVIFTHPPVGTVGMNEKDARATHGSKVKIYEEKFVSLRHSLTGISSKAMVKLVCLGTEEIIIGCHIVGQGADELLQGFAVAIKMGAQKKDLDNTVAIHPTLAEELVTLR